MPDPHPLAFLTIPADVLIALDYRPWHFALQPYHYLVRLAHVLSMAIFFGGIVLLDLRLTGLYPNVRLRPLAEFLLPWLYGTFALAFITGLALFFYDPVHVGSHAYFSLKLIFIVLGLINAVMFHRRGLRLALAAEGTGQDRGAGVISLIFWGGVVVCACLNVEAVPKILLR